MVLTEISSKEQFDMSLRDHNVVALFVYVLWTSATVVNDSFLVKLSDKYPAIKFFRIEFEKFENTCQGHLKFTDKFSAPHCIIYKDGKLLVEFTREEQESVEPALKQSLEKSDGSVFFLNFEKA